MFRNLKHLNKIINYSVLSDITLLLFTIVILATYDYSENISPEYMLFFIQLILLWFALKILYGFFPIIKKAIPIALILWVLVESVLGLGQLYGFYPSKHTLFKTTGSFLNPGPYGGFIALIFPLALHYWLIYRDRNKIVSILSIISIAISIMILPATMSRTAWIATIIGCLFVLMYDTRIVLRFYIFWKRYKKQSIFYSIILLLLICFSIYGVYNLKKDSADGRLFMWKITTLAIKESPIQGVGMGGFSEAYADAQMKYFKSDKASEVEKLVAGSPEYAFNEYLQIFIENGLFGIAFFVIISLQIIYSSVKNKQIGAAGSFITLSVFAFASYPYHLWQFPLVWILLGSVCTTPFCKKGEEDQYYKGRWVVLTLSLMAICITSIYCFSRQDKYYKAKKEWRKLIPLYNMKAYESVSDAYQKIYPILSHNPKFIFEYGVILNSIEQRVKADSIFDRGLKLSCDPMFYNVKGRNYHEMGEYSKAEAAYINSTYLLPERIYPYYLLTKLYSDSINYQPNKMYWAANTVLEKEPKVHSTAINEMRNEVRKILKEKEIAIDE